MLEVVLCVVEQGEFQGTEEKFAGTGGLSS